MDNIEIVDINTSVNEKKNYFSIIDNYGEDITAKTYVTNPAIAREEEIKKMIMVLLMPEKSALLVGKPGIGKTALVEGLAYLIQRNLVPNVLQGYRVIKFNSTSLVGKIMVDNKEELVMSMLVNELKTLTKTIIFIDEIHTLIGDGESLDLANMLKAGLDRGEVKAIGATTTEEYNTYVVRDRAFLRRFERIDILEPDEATTVRILFESIPKIEKQTGVKIKYGPYMTQLLLESIVSATSEYKRVYGLSAMYPDIAFSILTSAFSHALFQNRSEVNVMDFYNAIKTSKRIYPDTIVKELSIFREKFKDQCEEENIVLPLVTLDDVQTEEDNN